MGLSTTKLGINLYAMDRIKDTKDVINPGEKEVKAEPGLKPKYGPSEDQVIKAEAELLKNEMNLLASSIRPLSISESETFTFNPFPVESKVGYSGPGGAIPESDDMIIINTKPSGSKKLLSEFEEATGFISKSIKF